MKRFCFSIFIFCLGFFLSQPSLKGQETLLNTTIDQFLTQTEGYSFDSQEDLAYHIFKWVSGRTRYNKTINYSTLFQSSFHYESLEDKAAKEWDLNVQLANYTAKYQEAVCHGYATLFYVLAEELGLTARIVTGFAHNDINKIGKKQRSNHAWVEVLIGETWEHIDPTWGAGYFEVTSGKFRQSLQDAYFLMPREYVDLVYEPLDGPKVKTEDKLAKPVYYRGFFNNELKLLDDLGGTASPYKFLKLRIENVPKNKTLYLLNNNQEGKLRRLENQEDTFEIPRLQRGDLMIFLDTELILGFKVR